MMNRYRLILVFAISVALVGLAASEKQPLKKKDGAEEDLKEAESGHGGGHGHGHGHSEYFQYARVPGHDEYEFGYRKGNPHHFRERHEQKDGHRFRTKLRWGDKHGGYGEHFWEYNHVPKHHKDHHHH